MNPIVEYEARLAERRSVAQREEKLFRWIGNARLLTGLAALATAFFVFGEVWISFWWLIIPLAIFVALVVIHARVVERLESARRAVMFYERGIARLDDRWMGHGQAGDRFRDPAHLYADDLDVLGRGSLFELLCTARTRAGEEALARWLLAPAGLSEASGRQESLRELAPGLDLREEMAVLGESVRSTMDPAAVSAWAEALEVRFPPGAPWIAFVLAAGVVVTFGLYLANLATRTPFLAALFVELSYGFFMGSRTLRVASAVNSPSHDLALLSKLLERLEAQQFRSGLATRMQAELRSSGLTASQEIHRLSRLVARMDWQRNLFFTPIALAVLWAPQVAMSIERWRRRSGSHVRSWISGVGDFEALLALA